MTAFVLGATGFVGREVVRQLAVRATPVVAHVRPKSAGEWKPKLEALGVPSEMKDSIFYEQYDTEPVINIKDPTVIEPLKERMQAALAKL